MGEQGDDGILHIHMATFLRTSIARRCTSFSDAATSSWVRAEERPIEISLFDVVL
jgi:hypothetical protein